MRFTDKELSAVAEAVETAYYWLSRDGKHTSPAYWTVMMSKLEKAHKAVGRAKGQSQQKVGLR